MSKNKVVKTISFNITNDQDKECLEHVKDENFSGYVKKLIRADIQQRKDKVKIVQKRTEGGGIKIIVG